MCWSQDTIITKTNGFITSKILEVTNIKDYNKFLSQEFETAQKEICGFTHMDDRIDSLKKIMANKNVSIKLLNYFIINNIKIYSNEKEIKINMWNFFNVFLPF